MTNQSSFTLGSRPIMQDACLSYLPFKFNLLECLRQVSVCSVLIPPCIGALSNAASRILSLNPPSMSFALDACIQKPVGLKVLPGGIVHICLYLFLTRSVAQPFPISLAPPPPTRLLAPPPPLPPLPLIFFPSPLAQGSPSLPRPPSTPPSPSLFTLKGLPYLTSKDFHLTSHHDLPRQAWATAPRGAAACPPSTAASCRTGPSRPAGRPALLWLARGGHGGSSLGAGSCREAGGRAGWRQGQTAAPPTRSAARHLSS